MRRPIFAALLAFLLLLWPQSARAGKGNRITVGPSGQFATIQEGVDAAVDGDQVLVEAGVFNESVVIAGKRDLFLKGGKKGGTIVIGTTGPAISLLPGGGLSTRTLNDDTQDRPVGQGLPNTVCVDAGADGICDTTAGASDNQSTPVGQGQPSTSCVLAGADGTLDTAVAANDDVIQLLFLRINSGPDGICDTTADPGDTQAVPVGQGEPNGFCVDSAADGICDTTAMADDGQFLPVGQGDADTPCVGAGPNAMLQTAPSGDDTVQMPGLGADFIGTGPDGVCDTMSAGSDDAIDDSLLQISSGPDGICEVAAGPDETQVIPVGNGTPDSTCVSAGADATLDTAAAAGDDFLDAGNNLITSGANGVCETTADMNDVQALPVGQGTPNSVCITADNPTVRNRNVKIQGFSVRAPNGFNGIHVDRSDFVEIAEILADATIGPPGLPPTGQHGIFVDARSVKPVIKSSTARFQPDSGFVNQGPGAEISACTAELNGAFGFLQQLTAAGAATSSLYTGNVAQGNGSGGFGVGGLINIFQRCLASQNSGAGFLLGGVGNILFQVVSTGNSTGVDSFGAGTRLRSSQISSNLDAGVVYRTSGSDGAVGSEIFSSTIFANRNAGVRINTAGVVMRRNQVGERKLSLIGRQDVGVWLQSGAQGTLLERNKLQNNFDVDGNVCPPNGTACDLVDDGMNNAGKRNTFNDGFVPPPGFVD